MTKARKPVKIKFFQQFSMLKKISTIAIASLVILTGCSSENTTTEDTKIQRNINPKEVEIFVFGEERTDIFLEKSASTEAEGLATVSAEISGKVDQINVSVGQEVNQNDTLITLNNSLNTELLQLQLNTAQQAEKLAQISEEITKYSATQTVDSAQIAVTQAHQAYQSAVTTKQNTLQSFDSQYDNVLISIDNAELQVDNAEDSLFALEDALDDIDDQIDDLEDLARDLEDPSEIYTQITQLETQRDQVEKQIDGAELALEIAENGVRQAENGANQLVNQYQTQLDQIDSSIQGAITQYNAAINQLESAQAGAQLQKIGAENQTLQANSSKNSAAINNSKRQVKAPISGKITAINIKTGQTVNPGQAIITIENDKNLLVKTSVTPEEADFIRVNDQATITYNKQEFNGQIISISPTLNPQTKKIDIEITTEKTDQLPTGAFVSVALKVRSTKNQFIPLNSVFLSEGNKQVRVLTADNEVQYKTIEIGEIIQDYAEVLSGLSQGDLIITTVNTFLQEGESVKILK